MHKIILKTTLAVLICGFFSCQKNSDPLTELEYKVEIKANPNLIISESGRIQEAFPKLNRMTMFLLDGSCGEIEDQGIDISDGTTGSFVIPSLAGGNYNYVVYGFGEAGTIHGFGEEITIESDTIIDIELVNYQTRYKIINTSNLVSNDLHSVEYVLKFSQSLSYSFSPCSPQYQEWRSNSSDERVELVESTNQYSMNSFSYYYPMYLESFHIKFYDIDGILLKTNIIDMENKFLNHETSYTFNVDLLSEWESSAGSRINVSIAEKEWKEETIEIN